MIFLYIDLGLEMLEEIFSLGKFLEIFLFLLKILSLLQTK